MAIQLVGKRFEHILESDSDSKHPTVFKIKELNAAERTKLSTCMMGVFLPDNASLDDISQVGSQMHDGYLKICKIGLRSAAPILDAKGKTIKIGIIKILNGMADPDDIKELAMRVIKANRLNRSERKKSETLPDQGQQD